MNVIDVIILKSLPWVIQAAETFWRCTVALCYMVQSLSTVDPSFSLFILLPVPNAEVAGGSAAVE